MVKDRPLRYLLSLIESRKPFAMSQWDVPEWHVLFGERNGFLPRDGYWYFDRLCRELTSVLHKQPTYHLSLASRAIEEFGDKVLAYIDGCGLTNLSWWQDAGKVDTIEQLQATVGVVAHVPMVMIAPPQYRRTKSFLRYNAFVDVAPRNQYLCVDEIVRSTLATLEDFSTVALVSVSAVAVAPLIVDALYRAIGHQHQVVDFGSLWEPFTKNSA